MTLAKYYYPDGVPDATSDYIREFDYGQLDPGIRYTVALVHALGWGTSDSGDGISKPLTGNDFDECVIPFPNVAIDESIDIGAINFNDDAGVLLNNLTFCGIELSAIGHGKPSIQYTYDPFTASAYIMLMDLSDDLIPEDLKEEIWQLHATLLGRTPSL